ncbi:MAG: hypothetical protein QG639_1003 [Patescibacteria group bacterium]|jgi:hypothetical protein|nr:hypothetical protein [Patescibacteria group bacterium]
MRLWSIHPSYLDTKGLLALWREGLLALHVLSGKTKGYVNHPQLLRFKNHPQPLESIASYLHTVVDEAEKRGYSFKREKLPPLTTVTSIPVTTGQLEYEMQHLLTKLSVRDLDRFNKYSSEKLFLVHPLFSLVQGKIEQWEKLK